MQVDRESLSAIYGIASGIVTSVLGIGVMRAKVERAEKQLEVIEERFVRHELFEAVLRPVEEDIREIKADLKEVLRNLKGEK